MRRAALHALAAVTLYWLQALHRKTWCDLIGCNPQWDSTRQYRYCTRCHHST